MPDTSQSPLTVSANFPGGNVIVERIAGDHITVRQDLRDTEEDWFYWYFAVQGAAGRNLQVTFTGSDVFAAFGPAFSLDQGQTWAWLGREAVQGQSFTYRCPAGVDEVRFSVAMPYVHTNFVRFIRPYSTRSDVEITELCRSRHDRSVEMLRLGRLDGQAPLRILLTCRHHCCEMMASYALEGLLAAILAEDGLADWYRSNVEVVVVPFVDKDGVEAGDQGKNRRPHDHNRDYERGLYPETRAIHALAGEDYPPFNLALDLHCPWIRGPLHEVISFVGGPDLALWERVGQFSRMLEANCSGTLRFREADNLPFGVEWNTGTGLERHSFGGWAASLPGIRFASSLELPYALAGSAEVNAQSARIFGRDLAVTIRDFLSSPVSE